MFQSYKDQLDKSIYFLLRTAEWRGFRRMILGETASEKPDVDGLIAYIMGTLKDNLVSYAKETTDGRKNGTL